MIYQSMICIISSIFLFYCTVFILLYFILYFIVFFIILFIYIFVLEMGFNVRHNIID